jgi:ribosomal protein L28
MARKCSMCERGTVGGASRSHSNIKTLRRLKINIQKWHGVEVCTKCIHTMNKKAVVATAA